MKKLLFIFLLLIATPCFGATVTWQGDESALWSVGGNWDTGSKPTAADDVVLSNAAACTINEAAVCRSFNASAYTGTLTHNAATSLTIGDATAGAGNVALAFNSTANMTYTLGSGTTSSISFISTSSTVQTINFNSHITGHVTFNAASNGSWQLTGTWGSASVNASQTLTLTKGTLDTNGQTCHLGAISIANSSSATLTAGASTITLYQIGTAGWSSGANSVFNYNTSTIIFAGATGNFSTGGKNFYNITVTGANYSFSGSTAFTITNNFTITGNAAKTADFHLHGNITVGGAFSANGNSSINRLLVYSDTLGTARTLTLTGATVSGCSNVDFRDIAFAGSPDFSGITGGSGDCGGNSGGTLTTADDWYFYQPTSGDGTYDFSDYTNWYDAAPDADSANGNQMASTRTVLPQDTCYFTEHSITETTTVDQDLPRIPGIDFTGVDAMAFHTDNISQEIYGSLVWSANVTGSYSSTYSLTFAGRGSHTYTPNSSSQNMNHISNMVGGTLTLGGNLTIGSARRLTVNWGTFDANNYNISSGEFNSSNSNTRSILMGSGTWTINAATAATNTWDITTTTNLTFNAETSSIVHGASTNAEGFHGGSLTYNNLTIATGSGAGTINGSNTFNTFTINAPKTVKFTAGTDQTVTSFVATGDASNLIHIDSTSASAATLSDTTGTNTVHYCHIGETGPVNAEGGATWDATDNCNVNTSTGWTTAAGGAVSLPINSMANGISQGIGRGMR